MAESVGIVGAGLAGLACAGALRDAGRAVRVFDKGRGPGGRASTRRLPLPGGGEVGFDHGAQYMTARDPAFSAELERWRAAGLAAPWPAAGGDAWVGTPGMNAPLRALAADLDVAWDARVTGIARDGAGWRLRIGDSHQGPFDAVVLALPAEQTAALAAGADAGLAALAAARPSAPCWTAMLAFHRPLPVAADVLRSDGDLSWAARNGAKPGRGPMEAWVLQASPGWSRDHLADAPAAVVAALSGLFAERAGVDLPPALATAAHRWLYARSARGDEGCRWDAERRIGACGDWLIGPRMEAAWRSGRMLGERIAGG